MADDPRDKRRRPRGEDDGGGPGFRRSRGLLIWLVLIGGVILIVSLGPHGDSSREGERKIYYTDVVEAVREGKVENLRVSETTLVVEPREGAVESDFPIERFKITIRPEVIASIDQTVKDYNAQAREKGQEPTDIEFENPSPFLQQLLGMLPWILILVLLYYMLIRQLRSAGSGYSASGAAGRERRTRSRPR